MATTPYNETTYRLLSTEDVREEINNDKNNESTESIVHNKELVQSKRDEQEHRNDKHS